MKSHDFLQDYPHFAFGGDCSCSQHKVNDCSICVCPDSLSFPEVIATMSSLSGLLIESGVVLVLFIVTLSAKASLGLSFSLCDSIIVLFHTSTNLSTGSNSLSGSSISSALTKIGRASCRERV